MGLCSPGICNCAIQSSSLQITGNGSPGTPYDLESTGLTIVTSVTRPGSPFLSQQILETDTDRIYYWDGSAWRIIRDPAPYAFRGLTPLANTDYSSGTLGTWLTFPTVTVPPWATVARGSIGTAGAHIITGLSTFFLAARLSGVGATTGAFEYFQPTALLTRENMAMLGRWTGLTPGATLTPTIAASRSSGTGALRFDTASNAQFDITWEEN